MSVIVKSPVTAWRREIATGDDGRGHKYEYSHWVPTLECGHPRYGHYHPSREGLPLEIECYPCSDIALVAVKAATA